MSSQSKGMVKKKKLSAKQFDDLVDSGKSLESNVDWSQAIKIVNVSLPVWMVKGLDDESKRLNIDRQAVIKTWLAEKLDQLVAKKHIAV